MLVEGLRLKEDGALSLNDPYCLLGARRGRFDLRLLNVPELAGLPKLTLIVDRSLPPFRRIRIASLAAIKAFSNDEILF